MRPGPQPLPTATKRLRGTLRPDRQNPREPVGRVLTRAPKAPDWLDDLGRLAWARLCAVVVPMKVLTAGDVELLAVLADQLAVYEHAAVALRVKGSLSFVVLDGDGNPKGVQAFPEVKLKAAAAAEIRRLVEHFGLSPASRSRVAVPAPDTTDDFSQFDLPVPLTRVS